MGQMKGRRVTGQEKCEEDHIRPHLPDEKKVQRNEIICQTSQRPEEWSQDSV